MKMAITEIEKEIKSELDRMFLNGAFDGIKAILEKHSAALQAQSKSFRIAFDSKIYDSNLLSGGKIIDRSLLAELGMAVTRSTKATEELIMLRNKLSMATGNRTKTLRRIRQIQTGEGTRIFFGLIPQIDGKKICLACKGVGIRFKTGKSN